jgi:hypothetical protein
MSDPKREAKLSRLRQVILDNADTLITGEYSIEEHQALNDMIFGASLLISAAQAMDEAMHEVADDPEDRPH